jgi:hypothetical protein
MDHSPYWIRPDLKPRLRRSSLVAGMLALGAGAMALWASREQTTYIPVITPVTVQVPAAAPQITVPTPEVKVTLPPPAEPKPVAPTTWHVLAPKLAPECIGPAMPDSTETVVNPECGWDDGFPAIAEDGSLIAMKAVPDSGPRGGSALYITFVDPNTSRVVRSDEIMSIDDSWADDKSRPKIVAKIHRRIAAVQRILDAGHYRTLRPLGHSNDADGPIDTSKVHAEFAGSGVRIVDPATSSVIWQDSFSAPAPSRSGNADELCSGWGLNRMSLWWDPVTKYVVANMRYRTGGCMCLDDDIVQVKRIP